jgi:hypothetical protein
MQLRCFSDSSKTVVGRMRDVPRIVRCYYGGVAGCVFGDFCEDLKAEKYGDVFIKGPDFFSRCEEGFFNVWPTGNHPIRVRLIFPFTWTFQWVESSGI